MIRYVFRDDEPLRIKAAGKADPQVIGAALNEIAVAREGRLTPKDVVDTARAEQHPLHQHFEWDDSVAGELYRVDQARNIIRVIRVEDGDAREGTSRAFLSIKDDGVAYRSITEVKSSADLQDSILRAAERDLEAFERRYRDLVDVCALVKKAKEVVRQKRGKIETRAAA
jgi:hypothetical protein